MPSRSSPEYAPLNMKSVMLPAIHESFDDADTGMIPAASTCPRASRNASHVVSRSTSIPRSSMTVRL